MSCKMVWVEEEQNSDQSNKTKNIRDIMHTSIQSTDRAWNAAGSRQVKKSLEFKKKKINLETMEGENPKGYSKCKKIFA